MTLKRSTFRLFIQSKRTIIVYCTLSLYLSFNSWDHRHIKYWIKQQKKQLQVNESISISFLTNYKMLKCYSHSHSNLDLISNSSLHLYSRLSSRLHSYSNWNLHAKFTFTLNFTFTTDLSFTFLNILFVKKDIYKMTGNVFTNINRYISFCH